MNTIIDLVTKNSHAFMIKNYKIGALMFNEGEICKALGVILEGEITISTLTSFEQEYTINILTAGMFFGETLLFASQNKYLGDIIATKQTKIAYINKEKLLHILTDNNNLCIYLNALSIKSQNLTKRIKLLSQKSIRDKILFYLSEEKKQTKTNLIEIPTKEKLSVLFNIPRPSLSRELIKLEKEGYIILRTHKIEIIK